MIYESFFLSLLSVWSANHGNILPQKLMFNNQQMIAIKRKGIKKEDGVCLFYQKNLNNLVVSAECPIFAN